MPDVLIFEDDPWVGDLAGEVLRQKGLTVGHYLSGAGVHLWRIFGSDLIAAWS